MYALAVEYSPGLVATPPLAVRWAYRELLAKLPGYRRRLELQADGYQRLVELFIYTGAEAVEAALSDPVRQRFIAANPACGDTTPALLVRDDAAGVVLLRRAVASTPTGGQGCWRDALTPASLSAELW